ncbi:hypothetical protein Q9S36_02195 [Microbacterium sp. ARD31]|uniref:hypothetical protein n=1 Tax=Microbacterium sp. ARD31 TaxID=2962576 RepID=UPI002882C184|nr:hypothetical protein [Microbacterium sp. ARD31]MDT0179020.1 hypothetical protein [Microbacterium sp. ARD31]
MAGMAPGIQQTLREIAPDHELARVPQREFVDGFARTHRESGGDPVVEEVLERTAHYLGVALGDLASIIDPEVIILTGWTAWVLGDDLVDPTKAELQRRAPAGAMTGVERGVSTVRGSSVAIGMATFPFERFLVTSACRRPVCRSPCSSSTHPQRTRSRRAGPSARIIELT